jgi:predicted permease
MIGGFSARDFESSDPIRPAIVSHAFWRARLGGDSSAIGRTLIGDAGAGIRIVGVLSSDFVFPDPSGWPTPSVLVPLPRTSPAGAARFLRPIVRLPDGRTAAGASDALTAAAVRNGFDQVRLVPIGAELTDQFRPTAEGVALGAAVLLILACVNLGGLAAARARDRWRELRIRQSLGARFIDVVRMFYCESALLTVTGVLLGAACAGPLLETVLTLSPASLPFLKPPEIDLRVLAFCALVFAACTAATTAFASVVGLRAAGGHGGTVHTGHQRRARAIRLPLVALQVALALSATVAGALMTGSLLRVWSEDPGFDVERTAVLRMGFGRAVPTPRIEQLLEAIRRQPEVLSAGSTDRPVLQRAWNGSVFTPPPGIVDRGGVESMAITSGFLESLGLRPVHGHLPTPEELRAGLPVIAVSEVVARQYWPGEDAVGRTLISRGRPFTVVGIVRDARYLSLDQSALRGVIYWPIAAKGQSGIGNIVVRFRPDSPPALEAVIARAKQFCPTCVWTEDDTFGHTGMLSEALGWTIRKRRLHAWVFSGFGVSALVITATGIFGIVAMATSRRTREIGVRLALGSTPAQIVSMILREQMESVSAGLAAGAITSAWTVRLLQAQVYQLGVYDWVVWSAAIGLLVCVALSASLLPSLPASRLDPARALRVD